MRQFLIMFVIILLAVVVRAQEEAIRIDWPPDQTMISGTVDITGTVNPEGLRSYFLEAALFDPASSVQIQWLPVSLPSLTPVIGGLLAQWNTTTLPDGVYVLRLHVVLSSGESLFYAIAPIGIANLGTVEVEGPVRVFESPEGIEVAPVEPTPEPTAAIVPSPDVINELPVPVGGHVLYFADEAQTAMHNAGMTWVKWQIPYTLGLEDTFLDVARDRIDLSHAAGFQVLLSITGDVGQLRDLGEDYYPAYADLLGRTAALGPNAIEVWNEMNIDREWPTGRIDPQAYADMLQPAYAAIKAANPAVMVITGALAPTGAESVFGSDRVWNDDRYTLGMANAGVAESADCIGLHYNEGIIHPQQLGGDPREPDYPTRYFQSMLDRIAFPFRLAGSDIPLCLTEMGYLSPEGYGPLPGGFAWAANTSIEEQAAWLRDAIVIAGDYAEQEIALIIIWNVDFDNYEDDPQAGYAIIRADGTCPACATIAELRGQ